MGVLPLLDYLTERGFLYSIVVYTHLYVFTDLFIAEHGTEIFGDILPENNRVRCDE
jgi:hypothetical protein